MQIASTLLNYGAETNIVTKQGVTPLHLASQEGHMDMVTLLLDKGANIHMSTKVLFLPLVLAKNLSDEYKQKPIKDNLEQKEGMYLKETDYLQNSRTITVEAYEEKKHTEARSRLSLYGCIFES